MMAYSSVVCDRLRHINFHACIQIVMNCFTGVFQCIHAPNAAHLSEVDQYVRVSMRLTASGNSRIHLPKIAMLYLANILYMYIVHNMLGGMGTS